MGQQIGSRVLIGVALAVVAALGITQPGASAESATSVAAGGILQPDFQQYPTVCPKPTQGGANALPEDPCEPPDPCADDTDGDGIGDCEDPCPTDPSNTCNQPPPTTTAPPTKAGADRRLVVLTSETTGTFRTGRPTRAGRYYVTVTSPEQPLCAPARSSAVRVKRG